MTFGRSSVLQQHAAKLADKAYVSWGSVLGIVGAAVAYLSYDHRSQLDSLGELLVTKLDGKLAALPKLESD